MLNAMNQGHAALSDWGLSRIKGLSSLVIAKLDYGDGRNVRELLRHYPIARLYTACYSVLAVCRTRAYNKPAIVRGRYRVLKVSVQFLPPMVSRFDLAIALEIMYFWLDLAECFTEAYRILKCGGSFLIYNESDGTGTEGLRYECIIDGTHYCVVEKLETLLRITGFSEMRMFCHKTKSWFTVLVRK